MKKILVVDDDLDTLDIVKYVLSVEGFNVFTHDTGIDIPRIVSIFEPNLILLDIKLRGKPGTEVCKELKQFYSYIPVLFFSAHAESAQSYTLYDADGFIHKPFDINNFISQVKSHFD